MRRRLQISRAYGLVPLWSGSCPVQVPDRAAEGPRLVMLPQQTVEIDKFSHFDPARKGGSAMFDAHGRQINLTATNVQPARTHPCTCARTQEGPRWRGFRGAVVVRVTVVLTVGLVVSVLLVVIRDVITTLASGSAVGLIVKALLAPSSRRGR